MTKLFRLLLVATCFPMVLCPPAFAQKSGPPDPNASLQEILDWLKANIPYSYVQPQNRERTALRREAISHVRAKGCRLNYEITSDSFPTGPPGSTDYEDVRQSAERQQWAVDLAGLNPSLIKFETSKQEDRPPRIRFSSFDPNDPNVTSQLKKDGVTVFVNYSNKAIWHSDRMGDHAVREEFVGASTFAVKDEVKGRKIVSALIHAAELCRQAKPVKPNP